MANSTLCTCMLIACTRMLLVYYSYVLVYYSCLLVCYSCVLVCTRMYSYVLACYSYVCRLSRYVICTSACFRLYQEPLIKSLQQPRIPVTAFSQTDLFLVWIYLEFRSHRSLSDQLQLQARTIVDMSTCRHDVDMFTWGRIVLSLPKRVHVD